MAKKKRASIKAKKGYPGKKRVCKAGTFSGKGKKKRKAIKKAGTFRGDGCD